MNKDDYDPSDPHVITHTERLFYLRRPNVDMVCIEDIAHALANICRFTGHTSRFYSVAQHSVIASTLIPDPDKMNPMVALLHDASEAYIGDISTPLKGLLNAKPLEREILSVIGRKFNVELIPKPEWVHRIDDAMYGMEKHHLINGGRTAVWKMHQHWAPTRAKREFLKYFQRYGGTIE